MGDIAIIGGGIVGASIAYHLSQLGGHSVKIYERGTLAGETTKRSVAMFGHYGNSTELKMKKYGAEIYNDFSQKSEKDLSYKLTGRLVGSTTEEGNRRLFKESNQDFDDPICHMQGKELKGKIMCPYLNESEVLGVTYQANVGYLNPVGLAQEFMDRAEKNGVGFYESSEVSEIVKKRNAIEGLVVNGRFEEVDSVVCAAGPWNLPMARLVGIQLPVTHTLAPILILKMPNPMKVTLPFFQHIESGMYVMGRDRRTVYIGQEPDGEGEYDPRDINDEIPAEMREKMLRMAKNFFPVLRNGKVIKEWVGIRSRVSDGIPIVGWTEIRGFSIAAFDSSGIQLAPAVGNIIAKQLLNGDPTDFYDKVSISRFEGYRDVKIKLD